MEKCRIDVNSRFVIDGDRDEMQLTCEGSYEYAPERQSIVYDEYTEESSVHVVMTAEKGRVDIDRTGLMSLRLKVGETVRDDYVTEFGMAVVEYTATRIKNSLTPEGGRLELGYSMNIGGVATRNIIRITVTPDA